jgi:putative molybdopterin biosynthesis protein
MLREFAAPLLEHWGLAPAAKYPVRVRLSQPLNSDPGFDEFVPVFVGRIGGILWGIPHLRGSGVQMATVKANGYTHIPAPIEGYDTGHELEVLLTTDPGSIERTLILTGSLDPALESLANLVHDRGLFIHATNVGNTGGLLALKRNTCHAAPMSLPSLSSITDARSLKPVLSSADPVFVHIAKIEQGIASCDGLAFEDVPGVRFINTKKDSSARKLFDTLMRDRGIDPATINGYLQEVNGPQAVAATIRNGFADAGMCTSGVAEACGLQFVPVAHEDYELVIRREMLTDPRICDLISLVGSAEFRKTLQSTGGYDYSSTGKVRRLSEDWTLFDITQDAVAASSFLTLS